MNIITRIPASFRLLAALLFLTLTAPAQAPPAAPAASKTGGTAQGFHVNGERWTFRDGDFEMGGILLKPDGKGPFPAVLISHGLGGTAENFGLSKAREMVKWGLVCIAPDYTHSAKFLGGARPGAGRAGAKRSPGRHPADAGASAENIRRARTCIEIVSQFPGVDAKRLAAYGHSMGGFVTIGLAANEPELLVAAAISGSGIAPTDGFPAPPAAAAEAIRTPFLMLHGGADPVVRPAQSASLKEVLGRNKVPAERHVFEGEGHPIDQTRGAEVYAMIREWFTRHGILKP